MVTRGGFFFEVFQTRDVDVVKTTSSEEIFFFELGH
jgi:hypothetical protein